MLVTCFALLRLGVAELWPALAPQQAKQTLRCCHALPLARVKLASGARLVE